jgi:hypothetical protein
MDSTSQRLHRLARLFQIRGWDISVLTPPGYPDPEHSALAVETVDDIEYRRLRTLPHHAWFHGDVIEYLSAAITGGVRGIGAGLLVLGGDIVSARTGSIAATRLNTPYVLHLCDASLAETQRPEPGSRDERPDRRFQATVELAAAASLTIVRSRSLGDRLAEAGVANDKIIYLPDPIAMTRSTSGEGGAELPSKAVAEDSDGYAAVLDRFFDRLGRVAFG